MKKLIFAIFFLTCINHCYTQKHVKYFSNCRSSNLFGVKKGDTVLIQCDSVLLLNRKFAGRYNDIISGYEDYISLLNVRIDEQEIQYRQLRLEYDTLFLRSLKYISKTDNDLLLLRDSVGKSILYVNKARQDLEDIKADIKKGMKKNNLPVNVIWGVSGVAAGILAGVLIGFLR